VPTTSTEERTPGAEQPPADGRRPARLVAVVAVTGTVVVLLAGWWWYAGQQRALLTIGFDAVPIECSTGNVTVEDLEFTLGGFEPYYVTMIEASADLDCHLRVHVVNDGRFTARIREIEIPYYGPGTGASIHASGLSPLGVEPLAETPGEPMLPARDALYAVDYPLEPGGRLLLTIGLRHNPAGCMSPGATMWSGEEVLLHASTLGRTGSSTTGGPTFAQRGTGDSSCDRDG
jgi:hypothetical protein